MMQLGVTNLVPFYLVTGALTGLGFSCMFVPATTIIALWFSSRLGLATGVAQTGAGAGQFLWTPLLRWLLGTKGGVQKYLLCNLVDLSIRW